MRRIYMTKLLLPLCLLFLRLLSTQAQYTISGYLSDAESGEALIGGTVYNSTSKKGTSTNAFGFFSLACPSKASQKISFSYVGYKETVIEVVLLADTLVNMGLKAGVILDEVLIHAETPIEERSEVSTVKMTMEEVKRIPALGGEIDMIKALQLLPGVSRGNEGASGMYVRGGTPDQNLMLLDDVPLYYVNHLGGFVSIFNPDAINDVTLIKGGFPARYGSRLSSVLDVRMKNGDLKKHKGQATIGLISSKLTLEGPIKRDTSSYIVSIRRMMYDVLMRPLTPLLFNGFSLGYNFYDVNVKLNHRFSDQDRLYLSLYTGDDRSINTFRGDTARTKSKLRWGNTLGALRWNHIFNHKLFSNTTASYTQYRNMISHSYSQGNDEANYRFLSKVSDFTIKSDFQLALHNDYTLRAGGAFLYHFYQPTMINSEQTINDIQSDSTTASFRNEAMEFYAYLENDIRLSPKINFNLGLRFTEYKVEGVSYPSLEPRLAFNYRFLSDHALKLGYAKMQQNIHLLTSNGTGMPTDYWLPPTKKLKPQNSVQYTAGWAHTTKDRRYEMSVEAYYKEMQNLISFKDGAASFTGVNNWEDQVISGGQGITKGIEFFIKKKKGKTTGWLSYTLSNATRQFEELNKGETYTFRYDRLHDISIVAQHRISPSVDFFASWNYNTGNAITLAKAHYLVPNEDYDETKETGINNYPYMKVELYDGVNDTRMRAYHRLDIGINFTKKKSRGERVWNVSIYNLYNRQNAYFYFWSNDRDVPPGEPADMKLYQQSLFPFIPSVSYSFTF